MDFLPFGTTRPMSPRRGTQPAPLPFNHLGDNSGLTEIKSIEKTFAFSQRILLSSRIFLARFVDTSL
jgi:hypothetical protein